MWPMFVDYSEEECRRVLRSLELEAYASIINAFRAQGTLTKDRKKMLQELCSTLGISMERHRAEVRRAVNDEHLNTIAERLSGPNTATEWAVEGRRVVPLMQRLAPQTVFTEMANSAASAQAVKNASLPHPGKTGVREISNGIETMACRKRKDFCSDASCVSPHKMSAMDSQFFQNLLPFDSTGTIEPSHVLDASLSSEGFSLPEVIPQVSSSFSDLSVQRSMTQLMTNPMSACSPPKSTSKHSVPKASSTVTTFSSFDQMTSNLLSSKATPVPVSIADDQVSDVIKPSVDLKSAQRPLSSSLGSIKSSTIVIPTPTSSASSTPKDRSLTPSSASSQSNKFLPQMRSSKTPSHARQNMPAGLGIKLSSQPTISQRATIPSKSPIKIKSDNVTIFSKKASSASFPSPGSDCFGSSFCNTSQCESVSNLNRSPLCITKSNPKTEPSSQQLNSKQTTTTKALPKTTASNSQLLSRSLFSTTNKGGAKSLSPVIFNVASTSSSTLQTTTKPVGSSVSEVGKTTTQQLLSKSATVGLNSSHLKITSSNSQTIQYRNDGGLVRSARIVNISQSGTHLPCAISPSAISALGLSSASGALRVTLPAGSLSANSAIRVSSAAKPNVIVVHKAQMWPRAQQGAAVIMSSTPISKLTNDVESHPSPKQDKSKPTGIKPLGTKPAPRAIAPARPLSPAVLIAKASESNISISTHRADSSLLEAQGSKISENMSEAQCRKNLLADIMEASGILHENNSQDKSSNREKGNLSKRSKDLSNHQGSDIISEKISISSSSGDAASRVSDSNKSKEPSASNFSGDTALTVSPVERNGVDSPKQASAQAQSLEAQSREACNTIVSSSHNLNDSVTSSSESGTKVQKEIVKDKDS